MNFIGAIEGMNFSPISGYNGFLKTNASFDMGSGVDFENVLNSQKASLAQSPKMVSGGIETSMNFDDLITQSSSSSSSKNGSAGDLIKSLSSSLGGGINSVNQSNIAAEKAQESFAMGEDISVHDVMIAAEKSSLSMNMALQLRNKMVAAYNEINNVRV